MSGRILVFGVFLAFLMMAVNAFPRESRKWTRAGDVRSNDGTIRTPDLDRPLDDLGSKVSLQADTLVLGSWTFDAGDHCTADGWTSHDITEQSGCYWHIDDFSGLGGGSYGRLVVLEGTQSLWCGARPDTMSLLFCSYAALPGYGNNWDQGWCFECFEVPDTEQVFIDYLISWDSEPMYDAWSLEYATQNTCDSLQDIDDIHVDDWVELISLDDIGTKQFRSDVIPAGHEGAIRIRFRFESDRAYSDEDGLWDTDGAVIIDSLTVRAEVSGTIDFEDFEDESTGDLATTDGDWECCVMSGYGDFAGLFCGCGLLQDRDPCKKNLSCMWAFIRGSTETYACGGHPEQPAVPKGNHRDQYIFNEIWSPMVELSGSGSDVEMEWDIYRDLNVNGLVFPWWAVRSWVDGCPVWRENNIIFYYIGYGWTRTVQKIGYLIEPNASHIQVSLGVVDMCGVWCLIYGDGSCHSHSPLYDNVEVREVSIWGPMWSVRDIDQFQDTFPENGTSVGTGRIDMALDVAPQSNPNLILPGDSATVTLSDPAAGLREPEPYTGFGAAAYFYLSVDPQRPLTTAAEGDAFRWPFVDSLMCNGRMWYQFRMDTAFIETGGPRTGPVPDRFCIDLNDNYFTNGDTLLFFYGAENMNNRWTWWSRSVGTTGTIEPHCLAPMEMQILPSNGWKEILYVDNFDGRGAQPYFDSAFELWNCERAVDRYDKRGPSSCVGNSLGGRVKSVFRQLIINYNVILWNSGDLSAGTVGDGTGTPEKADDFTALNTFLSQHTDETGAGIYISGDDCAQEWAGLTGPSALAFNNLYIPHTVVTGNHSTLHGISPAVIATPGSFCWMSDTMFVYGGCPVLNDFDQIQPFGISDLAMTYNGTGMATDGAVIEARQLNDLGNPIGVILSGFSFHFIRDDVPSGVPDRAHHMKDICRSFGFGCVNPPTSTRDTPQFANSLTQNYPNPFNPSTTIEYSIKERAHVTLKIYNVAGQLVRTLVDKDQIPTAEGFTVKWNGRSDAGTPVSSGVYFYKLTAKNFTQTKKMILLK